MGYDATKPRDPTDAYEYKMRQRERRNEAIRDTAFQLFLGALVALAVYGYFLLFHQ